MIETKKEGDVFIFHFLHLIASDFLFLNISQSPVWLSDFTFTFHFHALEKEMATHSSECLENPRDRGAWWPAVYGVAWSQTQLKRLSSSSSSMTLLTHFTLQDYIKSQYTISFRFSCLIDYFHFILCLVSFWVFY